MHRTSIEGLTLWQPKIQAMAAMMTIVVVNDCAQINYEFINILTNFYHILSYFNKRQQIILLTIPIAVSKNFFIPITGGQRFRQKVYNGQKRECLQQILNRTTNGQMVKWTHGQADMLTSTLNLMLCGASVAFLCASLCNPFDKINMSLIVR